jgi:hypothetical protein
MTTTSTLDRTSAIANGTAPIPFTFQAASADEVGVIRNNIPEFATFTVSLNGDGTGSVTPLFSWGSDPVLIFSDPDFTQSADFQRFGPFYPDQFVPPLDRLARSIISLKGRMDVAGPDASLRTELAGAAGADLIGAGSFSVLDFIQNLGIAGALLASFAAPAFANSAYHSSAQFNTNGATPGAWFNTAFAGNHATEGLTASIIVPVTASNLQTNALASYIRSDRAQPGGIGGDVALFTYAKSNANNCAIFAHNSVAEDTVGFTGQTIGTEYDWNVSVPGTNVNGSNQVIVSALDLTLTGTRIAHAARGAFHATSQWTLGYYTADGAIELHAAQFGSQTAVAGTNRDSQLIALISYNAANTRYIATMFGDYTGGLVFRPGAATGAVAFQNPTGTAIWAYISVNGFTLPEASAGSVGNPGAGFQTIFIDTADHKVKSKNSGGIVTIMTN